METQPVPSPLRKSPPWIMKSLMTRWNSTSLYPCGKPPFLCSPVQNCRKFSHVLGTTSPRSSMMILPAGSPPISMSKKHLNLSLCLTSMRSMSMTSMSKLRVFPARGWFMSRVTSSSPTSEMVAVMPWPTMSLEPTTVYSSPTAPTTSCLGTFMTFAGLTSPYASSGESFRSFLSPTLSPMTPLSKPGIIMPPPTVKEMGSPRSREESNCSPSSRVPT
mmetsp:Transcript_177/g.772  ORF Transcript_177/g.772 Transcript_177/m.772 type:complete len:218 (+) Transcript_177:3300-3953(+)